jgi:hypothetical protein
MSHYRFRHYEGPEDADRQYELWLRATADLPRAWPSSRTNVRSLTKPAEVHPKARIYAERLDGTLAGYIGSHPPFDWPPLGSAIPFGFPWTYPIDEGLEKELYDRMLRATSEAYAGEKMDVYVQRFRESWTRQIEFLLARGWKHRWRFPILARPVSAFAASPVSTIRATTSEDLPTICALGEADPDAKDKYDPVTLQKQFDEGWMPGDSTWLVEGTGAFVLDVRKPWAEVKLCYAEQKTGVMDALLEAIAKKAGELGAEEFYFTLDEQEISRMHALRERGFAEVDAGVYLTCEP